MLRLTLRMSCSCNTYIQTRRGTMYLITAVIKQLPTIYGLSLNPGPLRHAILALSATYIDNEQHADQMEFHSHKARLSLITRLATPTVVDEFDVLATFVLAIQAWTGSV